MQAVTELLRSIHLRCAFHCVGRLSAPFGVSIRAEGMPAFHHAAAGRALIQPTDGSPAYVLEEGDFILFASGPARTVQDKPGRKCVPVEQLVSLHAPEGAAVFEQGGGGEQAIIVGGAMGVAGAGREALLSALPPVVIIRAAEADPRMTEQLAILCQEAEERPLGSGPIITRLTEVLFLLALRWYVAHAEEGRRSWLSAARHPQVGKALAALHQRLEAPWTVERLARHAGMSRSAFAAQFQELVGQSPLQYLTRTRMAEASQLLRATDLGLAAIAGQVGYGSEPAFITAFKRHFGTSPGAHRKGGQRRLGT